MDDGKLVVRLEPWFLDLLKEAGEMVGRCMKAGVPVDLLRDHLHRLIADAAERAIRITQE